MKLPLLKPRYTLALMITGLSALGTMCVTTVGGLVTISTVHGLELLRPWILGVDTGLGIVACGCTILTAIGRSILFWVDHTPQLSPAARAAAEPPSPAASSPTALQGGTMAPQSTTAPNAGEQLLGKALDFVAAKAEANKQVILDFLNAKGVTIENAAETFIDARIESATLPGIANFVPRTLLVQGVNEGINELVAAGKAREDVLFEMFVGEIQSTAKALGG